MAALRVALLALALWALRRELAGVSAADFAAQFTAEGAPRLAIGIGCTVLSFFVLGAVEIMAVRRATVGEQTRQVPSSVAFSTAFIANAFSQSIGVALLTGTAVRARAYSRHGLGTAEVSRISVFVTLSVAAGLLATSGSALLWPGDPLVVHGVALPARSIGALLAIVVLGYVASSILWRGRTIGPVAWRLSRPSVIVASAQVGLSTLDWLLTSAVLFVFIPPVLAIGYWSLLRAYAIAQMLGMLTHIPAGAGVLELTVLALLAGAAPPATRTAVVASLLMFRIVYYLIPLAAAAALAIAAELRRGTRPVRTTLIPARDHG
jgi:phosphatidylglycerol lysyltransferase